MNTKSLDSDMSEYRPNGYKPTKEWLYQELTKAGVDLAEFSVEHTQYMLEIRTLAQVYSKTPLNVASDLKRLALKEAERKSREAT